MNTMLVWLLIAIPFGGRLNDSPRVQGSVIERLQSREDCERIAKYMMDNQNKDHAVMKVGCIQATIVK